MPSNHKAFLTKEGKKMIEDRKKDFQLIFLIKESNSYVFFECKASEASLARVYYKVKNIDIYTDNICALSPWIMQIWVIFGGANSASAPCID